MRKNEVCTFVDLRTHYFRPVSYTHLEQLTLAGLAPRKRRKRAPAEHTPAEQHPIAQVVLNVQALHLGQTFDYFIDEKDSEAAQPGVLVRVRFGGQRISGVIWARTDTSDTPRSSIRYICLLYTSVVGALAELIAGDFAVLADSYAAGAGVDLAGDEVEGHQAVSYTHLRRFRPLR